MIAPAEGNYRQSRSKSPQEQSLFASFSSEKEGLYFGRLCQTEPITL